MLDRILISQDVANLVTLSRYGGYGRTHILKNLVPMFVHYGITTEHLHTIMVENPKRLFPIQRAPVRRGEMKNAPRNRSER